MIDPETTAPVWQSLFNLAKTGFLLGFATALVKNFLKRRTASSD